MRQFDYFLRISIFAQFSGDTLPKLLQRVINIAMTHRDLTILVIDENAIRASIIEEGLREAGHAHVTVVHEVNGIARIIETLMPDVIIIDIENPNRDMMEHLFQLTRTVSRPIAMFVDRSDTASIEAAVDAGVSAYIVDGLKKERVKPILDMAVSRFNAFSRLRRELADARSALEERKLIERAKGILMKMRGLSEEEAFALLRQTAMNEKKKMSDIAQSVVTAAGLLM
jgi:response regulator NasT